MNADECHASIVAERESMRDPEERKLEWACQQIEYLLKEVSMLKNPEFWRLEAQRQKLLSIGDPCRTMSDADIKRFTSKHEEYGHRSYNNPTGNPRIA